MVYVFGKIWPSLKLQTKNHNDICKHEYLTAFHPYKQISSSEQKSNYHKNLQVNNISDSKPSKSLEVIEPEHNIFPPDIPNASLHERIINDFCVPLSLQIWRSRMCCMWLTYSTIRSLQVKFLWHQFESFKCCWSSFDLKRMKTFNRTYYWTWW